MPAKLAAWGLRVKRKRGAAPRLWLFTDAARLPDPCAAIRRLPRGAAGVVFRPEGEEDPARTGRAIAALCRTRRLALSVAGDWRLAAALGAGLHARGGRRPGTSPRRIVTLTASAHDGAEAWRARAACAVFLSPVFATASHPGGRPLGPGRWSLLARRMAHPAALGGVAPATLRAIPKRCVAVGAIGAWRAANRMTP